MPNHPSRAKAIFDRAVDLDPADRSACLDESCAGDAELRGKVQALLDAYGQAGSFLESPPLGLIRSSDDIGVTAEEPMREQPGSVIGRYKLLQQIGEGGFGVVYMAEQERPVKRRVALKVIKAGMDTRGVIARFEAERQALAMMDHPNIARVLDAGATDTGRPYFVMELVKGIPITEYCDQANLDMRQRLMLFMDVCRAVQHAHQKGVIHRDLKPSNIMITLHDAKPVVKVIDFGIAKATDQKLTEKTLFTNYGQMIGTPAYMSPEQAVMSGLDVDTRSDVYSLGILLYELLTGSPPFDANTLRKAGFDEMRRIIREQQPQKPSTRLSTLAEGVKLTVAGQRQVSPQVLSRQLHGDLDWIILKAIEKDRARRYETANGLAADLKRHLDNEPVVARPPSAAYRFQKAVRRNRLAFGAIAAITATLLIGIAASIWQAVRATSAEKRAVATLDELRATAPAFAEQARALAAREQFDQAIEKLDYALKLWPDESDYLVAKGDLLQCQLKLSEAGAIYRQALRAKPDHARAQASAKLCEELLAAPSAKDGKLTRESLAKLHLAMQEQQRPAAELMPVARLLGEEKKLLVEYWLARLKDLPVSAEKPLKDRLTVREDGRLALDLSDTKVTDLSPLAGAPLAVLNVSGVREQSELTDLSPLRGLDLIELNISTTHVADLTPLREMRTLEKLEMSSSKVSDLAALSALRLKSVNFGGCPVSDLKPIRKMPLEELQLGLTRIADISPLIGMPIKTIDLSQTPVQDFSPLAELPLEKCYLQHARITDLAILRGKPLKELVLWGCVDARNYRVLAEIKTLELLMLPAGYRDLPAEDYAAIGSLRDHPRLRQIGADVMQGMGYGATGSKEVFWQDWDREQTFVPALRKSGIKIALARLPTGAYALLIQNQPLRDLSILKGAPISNLTVYQCQASDLTPIHELKLEVLRLSGDLVSDLSPLLGMPLKELYLDGSKIGDLSPLKGLPLRELYLEGCKNVTDVAALAEIATLEKVTVPMQARNIEALHKLPKLKMLALNRAGNALLPASTADEFWKDYGWISRLRDSGIKAKSLQRLDDGTWNVNLENTPTVDLALLQGAPISILSLVGTPDLTPLRGMAIKKLWLTGTQVTDLSPLKGMPLERLSLSANTNVSDLSVLRGMPLIELWLHDCSEITDLSPLADSKALQLVVLPPNAKNFDFLRTFPKLERISFQDDAKNGYRPDKTAAEFWKAYGQKWAIALRSAGMKYTARQDADGIWSVTVTSKEFSDCSVFKGATIGELILGGTRVSDLRPLGELALTKLDVRDTPVADISALRGPGLSGSLQEIYLWKTQVTDFSPLAACTKLELLDASATSMTDLSIVRGRKLRVIHLRDARITDISVLAGMPLTRVSLGGTGVTDLSPLLQCPTLEEIVLPAAARNVDALRALPALTAISYETKSGGFPTQKAEEFWKQYEHDLAGVHARAGRWVEARAAFEEAIRLTPDDHNNWYRLAVLLAHIDDRAAYRTHCHAMLQRFGKTTKPEEMDRVAKTSLLLPIDDADRVQAIRLANSAAASRDQRFIAYFRFCQGFAQYRAGDDSPAVATLTAVSKTGTDLLAVASLSVLAMAQHRLGHTVEAQATLTQAEMRAAEKLPKLDAADLGIAWNDVLVDRMLLREARDVIGKK